MAARGRDLRLVLIGRTRIGKSASGNTILGQRHFRSQLSASSVTRVCEVRSAELMCSQTGQRRRVTVVDMPGFGDTDLSEQQIHTEVAKCVCLSPPGPHAFLLVVPIGGYTEQEDQAVRQMTRIFGEAALRHHTVVLFTRGDDLEGLGIGEFLRTAPARLKDLIRRCGGRYHVFNNRDAGNRAQVMELLEKVDAMVMRANPGFYTRRMYVEAEAALRAEERRRRSSGQRRTSHVTNPPEKVLDIGKKMVAAGATGFALGAAFGVCVPLATAGSAYVVGNSVGFVAGKIAGASAAASCAEAVGGVVATVTAPNVLAVAAVSGGVIGGTQGVVIGADAASPADGARETVDQVLVTGSIAVGAGIGVGAVWGGGVALNAALGTATVNSTIVAGGAEPVPPLDPIPGPGVDEVMNVPCPPASDVQPPIVVHNNNNIIINIGSGTVVQQ